MKNARKQISSSPGTFLNSVRVHNKFVKLSGKQAEISSRRQDKAFKDNPWQFAKSACSDSDKSSATPSFSCNEAWDYFSSSFSNETSNYQALLGWVNNFMPTLTVSGF